MRMQPNYQEIIDSAERLLAHVPTPVFIIEPEGRLLWGNRAYRGRRDNGQTAPAGLKVPIRSDDGHEIIAYTVYAEKAGQPASTDDRAEWYRIIAENTSDTIVIVDHEAVVRFVSPSLRHMTGFAGHEYEGKDAFDMIHPDDRDRVRAMHGDVMQSHIERDLAYRVYHADGRLLHVESRVKPVPDREGVVKYVVAVVRDVTERKNAEALLENILDNVNAAVWSTDVQFTRHTFCSESIKKITGIPRQEVMNRPIRLHDSIHPEDNDLLMGEVKRQLDQGQPVNQAVRLIHVEGEERWGQLIIHPSIGSTGQIERLDGILMDITEKKRSELALEESRQRYKSLFENNLDGVFSIRLDGFHLVNANPAFEQITGIPLSRLSDRCFFGMIFDEDHPEMYAALAHVMKLGKPKDIECRLAPAKYGEKIVHITFVPIFHSGMLHGIHGIVKDITRRKLEERELVESEKRYKFLQQSLNRFSNDLARVMKVSDLENRLMEEVRSVLQPMDACIEEIPRRDEKIVLASGDIWVQIGAKKHPVYLRIALQRPLLDIEEEWLETAVHYVTILYDNLHLIEDLMKRLEENVASDETPRWMLRLLFKMSEKERATLSSDLHDAVLQDLIIWYRKLESLRSQRRFDADTRQDLMQIEEGLLDAIHQIRITCNELRPPFLLKMGLVESLRSLFEYTRLFAHYEIAFSAEQLHVSLNEEQVLGVYRIVQELLNNANKHARAHNVKMTLAEGEQSIEFNYSDDGVGMELSGLGGSFQHMGLAGMEKRVQSLEGRAEFQSAPGQGFHVKIRFPK